MVPQKWQVLAVHEFLATKYRKVHEGKDRRREQRPKCRQAALR